MNENMYTTKQISRINIAFFLTFLVLQISMMVMDAAKPSATQTGTIPPTENYTIYPDYDEDFAFFLVNEEYPLPSDYEVSTAWVQAEYFMDERCADLAVQMIADAKEDGIELAVCSAYRSVQKQKEVFDAYVERLMSQGYSHEQAVRETAAQIASPGASEHNTGLALDIVSKTWFEQHDDLVDEFKYTKEFKWLSENSWKYGFILRYPEGKTNVTGIIFEAWHYRFVGRQKAEQIYCSGMCLEEYIDFVNS